MASVVACRFVTLVLACVYPLASGAAASSSRPFNLTNSCSYTVWPAISSGWASSSAAPDTTGFELAIVAVPSGWSGRLWGRTLCSTDTGTGKFTCLTGDCGSGRQDCPGGNAVPPATLAQFTLDGSGGMDWYGVSLVDGFNLPVQVAPQGAGPGGNCALVGCVVDLNAACPAELRVTSAGTGAVACKSACHAFGSPQYCCTGAYATPGTCKPTDYSQSSYARTRVAPTTPCNASAASDAHLHWARAASMDPFYFGPDQQLDAGAVDEDDYLTSLGLVLSPAEPPAALPLPGGAFEAYHHVTASE